MTKMSDTVAGAARRLVGVGFRPQGRDPVEGVDCVGVVVAALASVGYRVDAPDDYTQRGADVDRIMRAMAAAGLRRVEGGHSGAGDILLMKAGPAQLHLGIATEAGMVHAHAGLRRVVETPGVPPWPVLGRWRLGEAR
jgi:lipoprotein Spr